VDDLGLAVHAHVCFHPEVPLLALPRLTHLRGATKAFDLMPRFSAPNLKTGRTDPSSFIPTSNQTISPIETGVGALSPQEELHVICQSMASRDNAMPR
jgi:hypothetical protein